MLIDVHVRDGRTTFRLQSRKYLGELTRREGGVTAIEEMRPLAVWIDRGRGEGFERTDVHVIRTAAIAWVERVNDATEEEFLTEHDPELLERIRQRQRAAATLNLAERAA